MRHLPALAALVVCACAGGEPAGGSPQLTEIWSLDGFSNPESVLLAPDGETLFVSNVAGEAGARDGEGFISRVSLAGDIEELRWVEGLNAPKGMALHEGRLYVSDIDAVAVIDIAAGEIVERITVPDAVFLNDVAATEDDRIFVSDSGSARIIEIVDGAAEIFVESEAEFAGVNGLTPDRDALLVASMGTGELARVTLSDGVFTLIAGGMENADGVVRAPGGGYIVSSWPGRLFWVDEANGVAQILSDRVEDEVYMNDFALIGDVLVIPHWNPSTLSAHRIE